MRFIIDENVNGFLTFDLRDILLLIDNGLEYQWILQEMNINYIDPTEQLNELSKKDYDLCEDICNLKSTEIEYNNLERIAKSNIQIIDGIILGNLRNKKIKIKIFDGSYWTIETNDDTFSEKLKKRFLL